MTIKENLADPQLWNRYAYVRNNPLRFVDPTGRYEQVIAAGGFLFAMPAILLSGVMTPIRAMPGWLQAITYLNPVRYYAELMRTTLLRGAGLADLWPELLALLVLGSAILATATLRFHKRLG